MDTEQSRRFNETLQMIRDENSERDTSPIDTDPELKLTQFAIYSAEVSAS